MLNVSIKIKYKWLKLIMLKSAIYVENKIFDFLNIDIRR